MEQQKRRMRRVPESFRQDDNITGVYDPKVVSIGPYHHGKAELQICQNEKPKMVNFVVGTNQHTLESAKNVILGEIHELRDYYEESTAAFTDEEFVKMLLEDACFIIAYMNTFQGNDQNFDSFCPNARVFDLAFVGRDLALMENQIPFRVLSLVFGLTYDGDMAIKQVRKYAGYFVCGEELDAGILDVHLPPLHLLDAMHQVLGRDHDSSRVVFHSGRRTDEAQTVVAATQLKRVIQYYQTFHMKYQVLRTTHFDLKSFMSITYLKEKGIHVNRSGSKSVLDITFTSSFFNGELKLPSWIFSKETQVLFANLIAYELFSTPRGDVNLVIPYINFMKLLVVGPSDVKQLREKNIIMNKLDSDEDVVGLLRDLNTHQVQTWMTIEKYETVKHKIQEHVNSKSKTWMADLIQTYLSNPWKFIGLLVVTIVSVATVLQTYFTINPRK